MVETGFGRRVDRRERCRPGGLSRRDEEDHATGFAHRLGLGSTAQGGEHQVLVKDLAVVVAAPGRERLRHPTRWVHADVVHRDVEPTVPLDDALDHCIDCVVVSQVGDDGLR